MFSTGQCEVLHSLASCDELKLPAPFEVRFLEQEFLERMLIVGACEKLWQANS